MFVFIIAVTLIAAGFAALALVDQTGLVTVEGAKGTAAGRTLAGGIVTPSPTQFSYSALAGGLLDSLPTAAVIVVDTVNRKVYFTDDPTDAESLVGAATDADSAKRVEVSPDADQTGRSLMWGGGGLGTPSADFENTLMAQVQAAKPKKTVSSLVSGFIGAAKEDGTLVTPKLVVIDQTAGKVIAVEDDNTAAVANITLDAGNAGVLTLSEPAAEEDNPLIFEGGATS